MSEQQSLNEDPEPVVPQQKIPLANTTLVLAVVSVIGCIFYGIPGIVLSVLAIVFHRLVKRVYQSDPATYRQSYDTARAGLIIAIISLCISVATTIYTVYVFSVLWFVIPAR